jgi:hypothetical protein
MTGVAGFSVSPVAGFLMSFDTVYNGTLGTGFGQRFYPANDLLPQMAAAA